MFILGLILGCTIGVITMAFFAAVGSDDDGNS